MRFKYMSPEGDGGGVPPVDVPVTFDSFLASADPKVQEVINKAISEAKHKANQEAKGLRESKKSSEEILAKLKARFERDSIDDAFLDELQRIPNEKLDAVEQAKNWERKYKEAVAESEKYKGELTTTQLRVKEKGRDDSILAEISKVGIKTEAISSALKLISLESKLDEEGNWLYNGKPLDEYIGEFVKTNGYLLTNPVAGGAGKTQGKTNGSTFSLDTFNNGTPEYRKAHMAEYLKAMKSGRI